MSLPENGDFNSDIKNLELTDYEKVKNEEILEKYKKSILEACSGESSMSEKLIYSYNKLGVTSDMAVIFFKNGILADDLEKEKHNFSPSNYEDILKNLAISFDRIKDKIKPNSIGVKHFGVLNCTKILLSGEKIENALKYNGDNVDNILRFLGKKKLSGYDFKISPDKANMYVSRPGLPFLTAKGMSPDEANKFNKRFDHNDIYNLVENEIPQEYIESCPGEFNGKEISEFYTEKTKFKVIQKYLDIGITNGKHILEYHKYKMKTRLFKKLLDNGFYYNKIMAVLKTDGEKGLRKMLG